MKDEQITINLEDGFELNGILNKASEEKLIIFAHGLGGDMDRTQFFNGARFFAESGYSVFRFNFYGDGKNLRSLTQSSILTHAKDIDSITSFFSKDFKDIHIVAHSLGGPSAILSRNHKSAKSITLWDGSIDLINKEVGIMSEIKFSEELDLYIRQGAVEYLLSKEMADSFKLSKAEYMLPKLKSPTIVITGSESILMLRWKKNIEKSKFIKNLSIIEGVGHNFNENDTEQILFEETLKWLKNFD